MIWLDCSCMRCIKFCTLTLPFKLNVRWNTMYTTHTMCTIHTMYSTHKMCTILTMYFTHYSHNVPHTHHVLHTTCALFSSCTSHKCEPHTPCASFTPFSPLNAFVLVQVSDPMVDNRYQVQSFPNPAQQPQQVLFLLMMMAQIKFCSQKYRGSWSSGRRELWEATNVEQLLLIPEICHLNPIIGKFYLQKIVLKRGKWIKRGRECNTGRYEL